MAGVAGRAAPGPRNGANRVGRRGNRPATCRWTAQWRSQSQWRRTWRGRCCRRPTPGVSAAGGACSAPPEILPGGRRNSAGRPRYAGGWRDDVCAVSSRSSTHTARNAVHKWPSSRAARRFGSAHSRHIRKPRLAQQRIYLPLRGVRERGAQPQPSPAFLPGTRTPPRTVPQIVVRG